MKQIKAEKIITYFSILLFCVIICSPLLQMHIASDTYNLMDLGYFNYPSEYFLKDARLISTLITYLAGYLNLSYPVFIVGMEALAVIIASISIYILYTTIIEKANLHNISLKNILLLMSITIIIFNCMSLEYFLYAECSVMCLSVLLCILAAKIMTGKTKLWYLKSFLLVTIATFCYQGCINIFVTLVVLFLFIDKNKLKTKEILKKILLAGIIFVVSFLINIFAIYIINLIIGAGQQRIAVGGNILYNFSLFFQIMKNIILYVFILNFNLWPNATLIFLTGFTIILLSYSDKAVSKLFQYITLVTIAIILCILPSFFMQKPSIEPRTIMSIGSIVGISFIFLSLLQSDYKILQYIIATIIIGFFVFNTINTIQIFTAHIVTNKIDANIGLAIKYKIEQYEQETGNKITKVAYCRDENHRDYAYGYEKKLDSFTQRAFDNYYCIIEALNYYCDRKFEQTKMDAKIYEENFLGKDWDTYSDEQIVFKNDTMYFCNY